LAGNWTNNGTITAVDSVVNLAAPFSLASLGTLNRTRGAVNITSQGVMNNTGTTLALNATTGSWGLQSGIIIGGTIATSGGAELVTSGIGFGGTLDGVTLNTD